MKASWISYPGYVNHERGQTDEDVFADDLDNIILQFESYIIEFQMTRNRQNGEIQIAGFAPTRLIIFFLHADWLER